MTTPENGMAEKPTRITSKTLTGVGVLLCAAHRDLDGRLHGHTYQVRAYWPSGVDMLLLQARLRQACELFDHGELPDHLAGAESLAFALHEALPDAVEINVDRPAEMLFAQWRAA